ncbi:MAG TPA: M15 family metallopeptidase [Actinomycetota bacterium]
MSPPGRRIRLTPFGRIVAVLVAAVVVAAVVRAVVALGDGGDGPGAGHSPRPSVSPSLASAPSTATPASPADRAVPRCRYGSLPALAQEYGLWDSTFLDTTYALPPTYTPPGLVSVSEAGFDGDGQVRAVVIPDLTALREAAEAAGSPVDILVAYRSFLRQSQLFHKRVEEEGHARALATTARPGHSEHQLGTTVDFRTQGQLDVDQGWEHTPAGSWMAQNAWRYGFVMSYPRNMQNLTCYSYEPWHFRYFGREEAAAIHDSGLTPREFLWREDVRDIAPSPSTEGSPSS